MPGGRLRVLVVDDEPDLRELIKLTLEFEDNLEVVGVVGGAADALEAAEAAHGAIDVFVLDHCLGGDVSGLDIANELRRTCPGAKLVLFTAADCAAPGSSPVDAIVAKPDLQELPRITIELAQG